MEVTLLPAGMPATVTLMVPVMPEDRTVGDSAATAGVSDALYTNGAASWGTAGASTP